MYSSIPPSDGVGIRDLLDIANAGAAARGDMGTSAPLLYGGQGGRTDAVLSIASMLDTVNNNISVHSKDPTVLKLGRLTTGQVSEILSNMSNNGESMVDEGTYWDLVSYFDHYRVEKEEEPVHS